MGFALVLLDLSFLLDSGDDGMIALAPLPAVDLHQVVALLLEECLDGGCDVLFGERDLPQGKPT